MDSGGMKSMNKTSEYVDVGGQYDSVPEEEVFCEVVSAVQTPKHPKLVKCEHKVEWVKLIRKNLMSREHASSYMRLPCKRHRASCLWLLLLEPNTGGD